ncbi:hypothetical protein PMAYCL1PPCAC_16992 [Pristionchus mayeri]|uniref:G protein-coupled receptor n=1 Tax=Pristionchus mayeri TaxID=1317129 RepID=A0AAN5HZV2_9BILA|nr:hypothetical protein PMAYCL1PPCAC_16992 [Pristionchus mayeri]
METRSILALISSFFALSTTSANCLIIFIILLRRNSVYRECFFYVIYIVGSIIDVIALTSSHILVVLPSTGLLLDLFLSSTALGRAFLFFAWSTRTCQGFTNLFIAFNRVTAIILPLRHNKIWSLWHVRFLCFLLQFSSGIVVGIFAASREVYWHRTIGGSWLIQFHGSPSSHRFFRFVFAQSCVVMLTIACYVLLLLNVKKLKLSSKKSRTSRDSDRETRCEQALTHLAICMCTQELIYYSMYCYGFIMNANFKV